MSGKSDSSHNNTYKLPFSCKIMECGSYHLKELIEYLEPDVVTTIYGPGGSGKSCTCLQETYKVTKEGNKVLYVDTEGGFSVERFKQIAGIQHEECMKRILFLKPTTFEEQKICLEELKERLTDDIKLIVVDSIAMLYRLELGREDIFETNRELGRQLSYLTIIARQLKIPVLLTNQVYSNLENGVRMVGGDIMVYSSKCLIELQKGKNGVRVGILRKHRSKKENKEVKFLITSDGTNRIAE